MQNYEQLINVLERVLGKCYRLKNSETSFFCPKCNHHKRKLIINISSGKGHCWVCNFSAHNIPQLLKKLNVSLELIKEASDLVGSSSNYRFDKKETTYNLSLPQEFIPLWKSSNDIIYKHAISYLNSRNIGLNDILRYGIGYCPTGVYSNRVIIPSYDKDGKLNYFIARDIFPNSKFPYKNPPASKNVIIFESLISWDKPLVIVEGIFDAIAIRINAVPLLGKFLSKELIKKIIIEKIKEVYIMLDKDAFADATKLSEFFEQYDITSYLVNIKDKDPSELGFRQSWQVIEQTKPSSFSEIIKRKLGGY